MDKISDTDFPVKIDNAISYRVRHVDPEIDKTVYIARREIHHNNISPSMYEQLYINIIRTRAIYVN